MSIISKATIAEALGINVDDIPDSVYSWGKQQFFIVTGLLEEETAKVYRKFISSFTSWIKLPDRNIKSIDSIDIDTTSVTINIGSNVKFNEDSGLMTYTGGFSGGQKVTVGYTVEGYTHKDIYDLLITLFVLKGMGIFAPQEVNSLVKKVTIGKYSKTFGAVDGTLSSYLEAVDSEIDSVKAMALGDDGQMNIGTIQ